MVLARNFMIAPIVITGDYISVVPESTTFWCWWNLSAGRSEDSEPRLSKGGPRSMMSINSWQMHLIICVKAGAVVRMQRTDTPFASRRNYRAGTCIESGSSWFCCHIVRALLRD